LIRLDAASLGAELPVLAMLRSPHQWLIKGAILLASGFIAGFVARQIRRQLASALQTVEERDRAVSIFGQHVSPQVAELLLKQPMDFAGQERNVCVMFFDIREFSRIATERSPTEVMEYLNTLFGLMIPAVNAHHGIINKFLGDGFMAVFGAPVDDGQQCRHAVEAARAMLARVEQLNREQRIPPTRVGIGLHLGVALTGNVGSGDRKEYTVIGDVVNLASRIEQATKQFQASLLVSEVVMKALGGPAGTDLGLVELKGQAAPVRLFQLA
jgi:adenylate cyclase